jgi:dephospho-CoA kinase
MRRQIFADSSARERLEAIVHPLIRQKTLELMEATTAPYVIVAVPLLIETDFGQLVDRVLVVDCSVELQIERLVRRDGVTAQDAHDALAAQTSRESRLAAADDVIDNSGTFDELAVQVERLHTRYLNMAADCPEPTGRAE